MSNAAFYSGFPKFCGLGTIMGLVNCRTFGYPYTRRAGSALLIVGSIS